MGMNRYPRCCANCKWSKEADYFEGDFMACECHRFPPVPNGAGYGIFPKVRREGVCGEFAIMREPRLKEAA